MSILTRLMGNYADDLAKAAAKTTTKTATKTAAKTAAKAAASQADDVTRAAISKMDDIVAPTSSRLNKSLDVKRPNTFKSSMGEGLTDIFTKGDDDASDVLDIMVNSGGLSNKSLNDLRSKVGSLAEDVNSLKGSRGFVKSELPKIKRSDYIKATGLAPKDIPPFMQSHLSNDGVPLMANDWAEYLPNLTNDGQFIGDADDILELYEAADEAAGANQRILSKENLKNYFNVYPEEAEKYEQEIARNTGLGNQKINVEKSYGAKSVPVNIGEKEARAIAEAEVPAVAPTKTSTKALKATAGQKLASKDRLKYAADLGASTKQREELFRNYRLGDKGTTIGDYLKNQNVTLANIRDRSDAALNAFGGVKEGLLDLADESGITIDLPSLVGANSSALKRADLNMIKNTLGIDLENDILTTSLKPSDAEKLYTELRNRAFNYQKSDNTKAAGKALQEAVAGLGDAIDDSLESIKGTYGLTQRAANAAGEAGLGQKEVRNIIDKGDNFTVRDLRTLQQPWVVARDMVANKAPREATLNIAGIDTGLPNVIKKTTEGVGDIPLKAAAFMENHPNVGSAAMIGAGIAGGSLLGSILSGGNRQPTTYGAGGMAGGYPVGEDAVSGAGMSQLMGDTAASSEPSINGYTMSDLESAYFNAMMAGDTDAAKIAGSMLEVLENKAAREAESTKSAGIATKQRAAINVLNNLMNNFTAKGTIGGNVSQFMNMITGGGFDPQQYAYDTGSKGSLGSIIKALGDTGALSEGDQQRALQLLPSTTDTPQAAQMKYQQLLSILQGAGTQ